MFEDVVKHGSIRPKFKKNGSVTSVQPKHVPGDDA